MLENNLVRVERANTVIHKIECHKFAFWRRREKGSIQVRGCYEDRHNANIKGDGKNILADKISKYGIQYTYV